jgi:hypothetical protein
MRGRRQRLLLRRAGFGCEVALTLKIDIEFVRDLVETRRTNTS